MRTNDEELRPVKITFTQVGAVIHYETSKKLYVVAEKRFTGIVEARLLRSTTQTYWSTKNNFNVIQVIPGNNQLSETVARQIDDLVREPKFQIQKNKAFPRLYRGLIEKK